MFKKKTITINPWELSHHFNVSATLYNENNMRTGFAQLWAESENELYAVLEVEGWENDTARYRDIICTEYLDGQIVRQWTLEEV